MNKDQEKDLPGTGWQLLLLAGILIALSYGSVTTRGGYADDFAFLAYSSTHSYVDAVLNWSNTFNSRISQGVMMPLLLKGLAGDTPGSINWSVFHAIGLVTFAISVFLLYKIMQLFNLPWQASIVTLLVFSLNPIKNEAVMWPATIVGYIIPLCIFLLATWLFFSDAKHRTETVPGQLLTGLLFLFSLFAIEQLFPLFILVIAMRLLFFSFSRQQLIIIITTTVVFTAVYILVTFSGKTTERMDPFLNIDTSSLASHTINVLAGSLTDLLAHTPRILLDSYYRANLIEAGQSPAFILTIFTIACLSFVLYHRVGKTRHPAAKTEKQLLLLFSAGILVYLATLSPFMVLSYHVAARALYIPSLGIALMSGAGFAYLTLKTRYNWQNILLTGALSILLAMFVLINIFSEKDFARQWTLEQEIIGYVSSVRDSIPDGTELSIFNVPKTYGPSPDFVNRFGFNGIVNWIIPGRNLYGETQNDFSEVFEIPDNPGAVEELTIYPAQGKWLLTWTPAGVVRVTSLKLYNTPDNSNTTVEKPDTTVETHTAAPGELYGLVSMPDQGANYNDSFSVTASTLIQIPQIDVGLLQIHVAGPGASDSKLRLILHARLMNGLVRPYDTSVSLRYGFHPASGGYSKYFFISELSSVEALRISLSSAKENLTVHQKESPTGKQDASANRMPAKALTGKFTEIQFF
jgi:hypothetical protein